MLIMHNKYSKILEFDEAAELAKKDPEAFEEYRLNAIEALITSAPESNQQKLRRLQWRIEQERKRAPNPIAVCVKLQQMMWDSFAGDNGLIDALKALRNPGRRVSRPLQSAEILAFPGAEISVSNSD
jgi:hypothetical protein